MAQVQSTIWSVIHAAATGDDAARSTFASTYLPAVRAYLAGRWAGTSWVSMVEDATQEVFLDFFRDGGALERAREGLRGGFRAYLYGVVRVVALRAERARAQAARTAVHDAATFDQIATEGPALDALFDRAWALALVRAAGERMRASAARRGEAATRRVELLHLRFHEGLPIRTIAQRWGVAPAWLHHQYADARAEFLGALESVVAEHEQVDDDEVRTRCRRLLELVG